MWAQFLPRRHPWCRDGRTLSMVRVGRGVRSQTDYILGGDFCLFWNVTFRDPWNNLDHYLVLGFLHCAPLREHSKYRGRRKRVPIWNLTTPTREYRLFAALRRSIPKPKGRYARKNVWILVKMWRHVDKRVSVFQDPTRD